MHSILELNKEQLQGKRVLLRADLNLPLKDGQVLDLTRVNAIKTSLLHLIQNGASVVLASHFGRPSGTWNLQYSLEHILPALKQGLGLEFDFIKGHSAKGNNSQLALLENLRFNPGEEENSPEFATELAGGMDLYVNEAFACSHRAHASICAITNYLPAYAGANLIREYTHISRVLEGTLDGRVAILGGAKISDKLALIENLITKVEKLIVVGGMANTFLAAQNIEIGKSLQEPSMVSSCKRLHEQYAEKIILPNDFVVFAGNDSRTTATLEKEDIIGDIGPVSLKLISANLEGATTILWNGPAGIYEDPRFCKGTMTIGQIIAEATQGGAYSLAGGGDVVAALERLQLAEKFSFISTAGGAFLEMLEGKILPGIAALALSHSDS